MNYKVAMFASLLLAASFAYAADDEVRVLVFPSGTKPSVAAQNPTYETRKSTGHDDMAMMCGDCMKKVVEAGTKPAVKVESTKCEGFLCTHCGHMVWRDKGVEQKFTDKAEVEAIERIEVSLKASSATKPSVQAINK